MDNSSKPLPVALPQPSLCFQDRPLPHKARMISRDRADTRDVIGCVMEYRRKGGIIESFRAEVGLIVRTVNILVSDASGRTLLQLRDSFTTKFPLMWDFWGGAMSPDDASPAQCAARELREELAVQAFPEDFIFAGVRRSSSGEAQLLRFRKSVEWGMFRVCEGAGAAFLWRREIRALPLSKPVREHIETTPDLFPEAPGWPSAPSDGLTILEETGR